ncbi:MAG: cytochrome b [Pseudomonadota bacterium]
MPRYPLIQRLLHWIIAIIVLGTLAAGLTIGILDGFKGTKEALGGELTGMLYKYHKTFGVIILGAMTVRIIVKLIMSKPEYAQPLGRFEHIASNAVHGLLYVLLLLMPILGWLATDAGNFPVQFFEGKIPGFIDKDMDLYGTLMGLHGFFGWLVAVLLVLHIAGALKHWLIDRDGVMGRMGFF